MKAMREPEGLNKSEYNTNDKRVKNRKLLAEEIERLFKVFKVEELVQLLENWSIPAAKVNKMSDVAGKTEMCKQGYWKKVRHPKLGEIIVTGCGVSFNGNNKIKYQTGPEIIPTNE